MDSAHYIHPNYPEKHEDGLKPKMNKGPVIKVNPNMRYATSSRGSAILYSLAHDASVPIQEFAVKNDSACGTTVGPIIAAKLGIETVDMGIGCLSMHSIRETGFVGDVAHG